MLDGPRGHSDRHDVLRIFVMGGLAQRNRCCDLALRGFIVCAVLVAMFTLPCWAGPPFITNDPDPPDPGQFEIITSMADFQAYRNNTQFGSLLGVEVNYGADPLTQLTVAVPSGFSRGPGSDMQLGIGDLVLEYKHRFGVDADKGYFGVNPQVTFASGGQLGAGRMTADVPVLYQKQFGKTVVYTDLRYRWHASNNGGSYVFWGAVAERELNDKWTLGGELYALSRNQLYNGAPVRAYQGYNLGLRYKLNAHATLIFAAGNSFSGDPALTLYAGIVILTTPSKRPEPDKDTH